MGTGRKLAIGAVVVAGVTAYMAYLGAASSWQYYWTVDECLAQLGKVDSDRVRVSGMVAAGTLQIAPDRSRAEFSLQGTHAKLPVICPGPLPDNLTEGIDVVVEGRLEQSGVLSGRKVLTRCASKYESKAGSPGKAQPGEGATRSVPLLRNSSGLVRNVRATLLLRSSGTRLNVPHPSQIAEEPPGGRTG